MGINEIINAILQQVGTSLNNQFLSGGLVLGAIGAAFTIFRKLPNRLWQWFLYSFTTYITTTNNDYTYQWIMTWLHNQTFTHRSRRMALKYIAGHEVLVPAHGNHFFIWNSRPIWIKWIDEEGKVGGGADVMSNMMATRERITIRTLGRSKKSIEKIVKEAKKLTEQETGDKLRVMRWGGSWDQRWLLELREQRSMNTVFLPDHATDLIDDVRKFFDSEASYRRIAVPYRRGYLFYGPPGNGKSTVALGLASELNLPLYVLNLATITNDRDLEQAIYKMDTAKPMVLLIEDADTTIKNRDADKNERQFSLGTLLNVLDGVLARENLVVIITTNRKEMLDNALIRPGRIDRLIEFGQATANQIQQAIKLFFPDGNSKAEEALADAAGVMSVSEVQETLLGLLR